MTVYKGLLTPQKLGLDTTCELQREAKYVNNDVVLPDVLLKLLFTESKNDFRQHCQRVQLQGAVKPQTTWHAGQPCQIISQEAPQQDDLEYWLSLSG